MFFNAIYSTCETHLLKKCLLVSPGVFCDQAGETEWLWFKDKVLVTFNVHITLKRRGGLQMGKVVGR